MLIDSTSQHLTNTQKDRQAYFSTRDLKYAYTQFQLHKDTAKHCNFSVISEKWTGTYRFKNGFYSLTNMPAEFQKATDYRPVGLQNTYSFLDYIIIVGAESESDHIKYVIKCFRLLLKSLLNMSGLSHILKTLIQKKIK